MEKSIEEVYRRVCQVQARRAGEDGRKPQAVHQDQLMLVEQWKAPSTRKQTLKYNPWEMERALSIWFVIWQLIRNWLSHLPKFQTLVCGWWCTNHGICHGFPAVPIWSTNIRIDSLKNNLRDKFVMQAWIVCGIQECLSCNLFLLWTYGFFSSRTLAML